MLTVNYSGGGVYIVVGATSGIGRAVAEKLLNAGATVLAVGRNEKVLAELQALGMETAACDITTGDISDIVSAFTKRHGKLSGAVYTAGIAGVTSLRFLDEKFAHSLMDVNFWGMVKFMQTASKKQFATNGASFVAISSVSHLRPKKSQLIYSATKAAVTAAIGVMAVERPNCRFNTISPGWVDTEMTDNYTEQTGVKAPTNYLLDRDEVADLVLYLLSEESRSITGSDYVIDKGLLLE